MPPLQMSAVCSMAALLSLPVNGPPSCPGLYTRSLLRTKMRPVEASLLSGPRAQCLAGAQPVPMALRKGLSVEETVVRDLAAVRCVAADVADLLPGPALGMPWEVSSS